MILESGFDYFIMSFLISWFVGSLIFFIILYFSLKGIYKKIKKKEVVA